MKVPDKIYVHRTIHLGMLSATELQIGTKDESEYISKDALLEWLYHIKKQEEGLKQCEVDIFYDSRAALLDEIINKINSL